MDQRPSSYSLQRGAAHVVRVCFQGRTANGSMAQMQKGAGSQQLAAREAAEAQRLLAAVIQSAVQAQPGATQEDDGDDDATAYLEALEQMLGCCVKQQNEVPPKSCTVSP